jgi:hypothetical protein
MEWKNRSFRCAASLLPPAQKKKKKIASQRCLFFFFCNSPCMPRCALHGFLRHFFASLFPPLFPLPPLPVRDELFGGSVVPLFFVGVLYVRLRFDGFACWLFVGFWCKPVLCGALEGVFEEKRTAHAHRWASSPHLYVFLHFREMYKGDVVTFSSFLFCDVYRYLLSVCVSVYV